MSTGFLTSGETCNIWVGTTQEGAMGDTQPSGSLQMFTEGSKGTNYKEKLRLILCHATLGALALHVVNCLYTKYILVLLMSEHTVFGLYAAAISARQA